MNNKFLVLAKRLFINKFIQKYIPMEKAVGT